MHPSFPITTLLLLLLTPFTTAASSSTRPKNAILLSQVRSLTLRSSSKTTHRRVSAIPQLKCVSPAAICALHRIDVMRCTNQGSSYSDEDIQWSCKAELPQELRLGSTEVICEGYDSPDDPYVLKGSCGVEYRLVLTEKGEVRYPDITNSWSSSQSEWNTGSYVFIAIFVAVLAWILYSAFFAARDVRRGANYPGRGAGGGFWPGGGGGGDGPGGWGPGWGPGGDHDPPPPYPGHKPAAPGSAGQGWQPGFWSGLAGGAAATYLATRNNNSDRRDQRRSGGGWSRGESSSSSSYTTGSSARHESTGFGSTSRR